MDSKKLLGRRIRELRKKRGFKQEELAERVGLESASISNIENGYNYPTIANLENILKVLNCTFLDAFDFDHKNSSSNLIKEINQKLKENPSRIEDIYKIIMALVK